MHLVFQNLFEIMIIHDEKCYLKWKKKYIYFHLLNFNIQNTLFELFFNEHWLGFN